MDVSEGFYATISNVEFSEEAAALIFQGVSSETVGTVCVSSQKAVTWQWECTGTVYSQSRWTSVSTGTQCTGWVFSGQSVGQTMAVRGGVRCDLQAHMLFAARSVIYNPNESSDSKVFFFLIKPSVDIVKSFPCRLAYTGCFTTLGHNCRRWFPRFLWSKKFI